MMKKVSFRLFFCNFYKNFTIKFGLVLRSVISVIAASWYVIIKDFFLNINIDAFKTRLHLKHIQNSTCDL